MRMLRCSAVRSAVLGLIFLSVGQAKANLIIDTTAAWNGSASVGNFGYPETSTYGETITAPTGPNTQLNSFLFEVDANTPLSFRGYVYAWDGSEAIGPALFSSSTVTVSPTANNNGFTAVTFNTGGINLTAGSQYVLFGSISDSTDDNNGNGSSIWGQTQRSDTYNGGQFVFLNDGGNPAQWTSAAWSQGYLTTGADLAFKASFGSSSVPEPSTIVLVVSAFPAGLIVWLRRRGTLSS